MDEIRKKVSDKTRAILVNSPSNPTGKILSKSELEELYQFCHDRKIFMIADEAYEDLTYGKSHFAVGSLEANPEIVISLFSLSKSYSMTGWRAGYVVASEAVLDLMSKFVDYTLTCFPPFIMQASAYAIRNGDKFTQQFQKEYADRRRQLLERMSEIEQLQVGEIEGTFYAFPRYTSKIGSRELCKRLLERENVAVLPGVVFGPSGENHIRLSFSVSPETINRGMDGIKKLFSDDLPRS
jgi:aspartate/methionine/tyrosine aminotransferase